MTFNKDLVQFVIVDLDDIQPEREYPTPEQFALFAAIGQYPIPLAYRTNNAVLGTEASAESIILINYKWVAEVISAANHDRIAVQLVPAEMAERIALTL